jgi:hypothetical protein
VEQLGHVPVVEAVLGVLARAGEGLLELGQRVLAALRVREVGGEHEQLLPRRIDHPADVLAREGRELQVPAHVLARLVGQAAQRLLGPLERPQPVVEVVQPADDPARALFDAAAPQRREAIEDAVVDQRTEEQLGRVVDGEEVLRPDVLPAPEVVGHRHGVVVEGAVEQAPTAADVEDEGDVGLGQRVPHRVEVGMGRGQLAGRRRRHHHRLATDIDGVGHRLGRARRIDQRDEGDRQEAGVVLAEVGDSPVLGGSAGVEAVDVAPAEHGGRERGEHQLGVEAEQVEHLAALLGVEGTHRRPALVLQQPLLGQGRLRRVGSALLVAANGGLEDGLERLHALPAQPRRLALLDERVEEIGQLHDVAVGIEDAPALGVGHVIVPLDRW